MNLKMDASMRTNTNNYKQYGFVYSEQCTKCIREGTPFCALKFSDDDNGCENFKPLSALKY